MGSTDDLALPAREGLPAYPFVPGAHHGVPEKSAQVCAVGLTTEVESIFTPGPIVDLIATFFR